MDYKLRFLDHEINDEKLKKLIKYLKNKKIKYGDIYEDSEWLGNYKYYFIEFKIDINENNVKYKNFIKYIERLDFD